MKRSHASDQRLQRAIIASFDRSADVASEHIGVAVTDGAVTLSGEAVDPAERDAAVLLATRMPGVTALVDEIELPGHPDVYSEAEVARGIAVAIAEQPALREQDVTARVRHHVVTLVGVVAELADREAAERAVHSVPGVRGIVNDLRVLPKPGGDEARQRIAEALVHGARTEIEHMRIDVSGHRAVLQGSVHSYYERRAAERAARSVPGINDVDNQLDVAF